MERISFFDPIRINHFYSENSYLKFFSVSNSDTWIKFFTSFTSGLYFYDLKNNNDHNKNKNN